MKVTETQRTYAIEITQRQMHILLERDERNLASRETLLNKLLAIKEVSKVEYDPMTGCVIFCRIDIEGVDILAALGIIKRTISRYVR